MNHRYGRRPAETLTQRLRVRVQQLIEESGLTQADLAQRLGVDQAYMSRFRTGQMKNPPLDFLEDLCRCFNRPLTDVLAEVMPPPALTAATGPNEIELLEQYRALDAEAQSLIRRQLALWTQLVHAPRALAGPASGRSHGTASAPRPKGKSKRPAPPPRV